MRSTPASHTDPTAAMMISDLAARTGVPAATLRSWEVRHGFPVPTRLAGGHRRYRETDVSLVAEVLRHRESGLSLQTAIERVNARGNQSAASVFAGLREHHHDLTPQILRKSTMLAVTRAIEDECCARAERPVVFASFQSRQHFQRSRARWDDLTRTARSVTVFADFARSQTGGASSPVKVRVPENAPMRREWTVVCDGSDYPAALTGWELPGQDGVADSARRFETVWTVDPRTVRDAALICAQLAENLAPDLNLSLTETLTGTPPNASADLRRSMGVINRMLGYVEAAGCHE